MNLITDDDFREFVDRISEGCRITIVSDSCHSGGLIEHANEQIGESTRHEEEGEEEKVGFGFRNFLHRKVEDALDSRGIHMSSALRRHHNGGEEEDDNEQENVKSRSLRLSTLIDILKQKTGKEDIDVGKLRPTLFDMFGENASPKVKKFMKVQILNKLQQYNEKNGGGGFLGMVGSLAQNKLEEHNESYAAAAMEVEVGSTQEAYAGAKKHDFPDGGILISGCQTY